MASTRRKGVESSEVRAGLIEAAGQLMRDEGCAAVTAGRLAQKVGLKRHIVHYYFGTIDDLFLAVIRRDAQDIRQRLAKALESEEPLRMIWELGHNATAQIFEFVAMTFRRAEIRAEVKHYIEEYRTMQIRALERHLQLRGIQSAVPPIAMGLVIVSIAQALAVDTALGVSIGHAETEALVENWLQAFAATGEAPSCGSGPRPS